MKQSEMLALLKELRSDLQRYSVASDSIVPGAYVEALDAAIDQFEKYMWHDAKVNKPEDQRSLGHFRWILRRKCRCRRQSLDCGW